MAYVKQGFSKGQVLTADHLNKMEQGIYDSQEKLISGFNVKTINNQSMLGAGNININTSGGSDGSVSLYEQAKMQISRFHHQYMINTDRDANDKIVDIAIFAGQSNSCGRATADDIATPEDMLIPCPLERGFSFNNVSSTAPVQIVEPISANGSSAYGYIPAFINAYNEVTGRRVCAVYQSQGGVMLNKFAPYVLDSTTGEETGSAGTYYSNIVKFVRHAKTNLTANGYTVGDIFLVWCQGEADAAYLGNTNNYANAYEQTLDSDEAIREYWKERFVRIVEKLQEDVELTTAFIIRIGHQRGVSIQCT